MNRKTVVLAAFVASVLVVVAYLIFSRYTSSFTPPGDTLNYGDSLTVGQSLTTGTMPNKYRLTLEKTGNVVMYNDKTSTSNTVVWSSGTSNFLSTDDSSTMKLSLTQKGELFLSKTTRGRGDYVFKPITPDIANDKSNTCPSQKDIYQKTQQGNGIRPVKLKLETTKFLRVYYSATDPKQCININSVKT